VPSMAASGQQRRIDGVRAASGLAHIATELATALHRSLFVARSHAPPGRGRLPSHGGSEV
jgi:hypothetical protein